MLTFPQKFAGTGQFCRIIGSCRAVPGTAVAVADLILHLMKDASLGKTDVAAVYVGKTGTGCQGRIVFHGMEVVHAHHGDAGTLGDKQFSAVQFIVLPLNIGSGLAGILHREDLVDGIEHGNLALPYR